MKQLKRLSALLALLLCCAIAMPVYAHEVPDMSRTGSISVSMVYDGQHVGGGSLTLYRAGDISEDNGNYSFKLTDAFAASGASLTDVSDDELAKSLANYAQSNGLAGTTVEIGSNGQATAGNLSLGLYLVTQQEAADGYEPIAPFMVSVAMNENGIYIYDVNAEPKMSSLTPVKEDPAPSDPGSSGTPDTPAAPTAPSAPAAQPTPVAAAGSVLPQTGQLNWPVPVLTVLGMALFLAGWKLNFGRQRKKHEA